jgi:ACS family hexuronate transporter-like MFS transporter
MTNDNFKITNYRWRICALIFFATTINYVDRSVLSYVVNDLDFKRQMLGLSADAALTKADEENFNVIYGDIQAVFKFAYALGFILMGWIIDKLGTRIGYIISISIWSLSAISHSFARGAGSLMGSRFGLGIGEAGNFPSAIKTVAEWFPVKERSKAVGLFNAGANIGIIGTAFAVPFLLESFGWQKTFLISSSSGLVLLVCWIAFYRKPEEHKKISKEEFSYIKSDNENNNLKDISWFRLFPYRQTWAFAAGKFMTDCVWWFYLTWLPKFFNENASFKLDLKTIGPAFLIIYLVSDGGSIFFGWLSSKFISKGWEANRARKTVMILCALCVVPIYFASVTDNIFVAVGLIALAAAAHQGWSANLFTTVTDMFPKQAIGSVVGIGGFFGALGGAMLDKSSGHLINHYGYSSIFLIASFAYITALLTLQILAPKLKKAEI